VEGFGSPLFIIGNIMKINIQKSVTVVTPTVGSDTLADAVKSVLEQTYESTQHLIVTDGAEYTHKVNKLLLEKTGFVRHKMKALFLGDNVGADGYYGHRVYAAIGHLVNTDYVMFLDEDNWFDPNHVETMVKTLESEPNLDFAYSLRKIYSKDKSESMEDNCESLGNWPVWVSLLPGQQKSYLVDTSSYIFKRQFLINFGHIWHWKWGADRRFFQACEEIEAKYKCSNEHTLCYRLDGNPGSVNMDFFKQGNAFMLSHYGDKLPWKVKA
jgi:glycosyltransferase involved in cell wall biosynthesis